MMLSGENFIKEFKETHGDFYNYSKFVYINNRTKGTIICPLHGEFEQRPHAHKRGQGCPRCKAEKTSKNKTLERDVVIKQFQSKHGNLYDYSKFSYKGVKEKSIIICPSHGEFNQTANDHKSGSGCPKCKYEQLADKLTLSRDDVIKQFREVHGDLYNYSNFTYYGNAVKGTIICSIHGMFQQSPNSHKRGQGCPSCKSDKLKGGYSSMSSDQRTDIKNVYLYHIELEYNSTLFHKIGITINPLKRFSEIQRHSQSNIINGWIQMYENAEIAFILEQELLNHMKFNVSKKYRHPIRFGGETECFLPVRNHKSWNLDLNNIPSSYSIKSKGSHEN